MSAKGKNHCKIKSHVFKVCNNYDTRYAAMTCECEKK